MIRRLTRHLIFRWGQLQEAARLCCVRLYHGDRVRWGRNFRFGSQSLIEMEGSDGTLAVGNDVLIRRFCTLWIGPKATLTLGDGVFLNNGCSVYCRALVTIGANTLLGEGVRIYDHNHKFRDPDVPIGNQGYTVAEVCIGRNCWIGSHAVILRGVTIGDHAIIGAGCVVAESVPPHTLLRSQADLIQLPIRTVLDP